MYMLNTCRNPNCVVATQLAIWLGKFDDEEMVRIFRTEIYFHMFVISLTLKTNYFICIPATT